MTLSAVLPVLATPFTSGQRLDTGALQAEVDWLFDNGASGVVIGMVSEVLRLSSDERDELTAALSAAVAGRGEAVASVGAESTHMAIGHTGHAESCGATAVMAIAPIATRLSDDELLRYYGEIVSATGLPVIVQDASGYLGNPLSIELQSQLFREFGQRVAFKPEAPPIGANLSALLDVTDGKAKVYEGTGGLALVDSYRRGLSGTMPGPDLCWALAALWSALEAGDDDRAYRINGPLSSLVSMQTTLDSFVAVQKYLLIKQGVLVNDVVRDPVGYRLDPLTRREVDRRFGCLQDAVGCG